MSIDVDKLSQDISPDAPCGEDISYDAAFLELETVAAGTPETQFSDAIEADWRDVQERCKELLSRSKHLRVMLYLAFALLRREGLPGFRDGVKLLLNVTRDKWDSVHPQLDPNDDNDPMERMNIIAQLATTGFRDPIKFKESLFDAPLCESKQIGRFSLRDVLIAEGDLPKPEGENVKVPEMSLINACFEDTAIDVLKATKEATTDALAMLNELDSFLMEQIGASAAPNLDPLTKTLQQIEHTLQEALAQRGVGEATGESADADAGGSGAAQPASRGITGEVQNNDDVIKVLDKVISYYEHKEPASPVPLLIERAKRLVGKSYIDIIRDLTPEAYSKVELLGGLQPQGY